MRRWHYLRRLWWVHFVSMLVVQVCQSADVPTGVLPGRTSGALEDTARSLIPTTPVSLELRDAEVKDVLRTLGQQFHLNLLVHEESKGLVTVSMRNVPLRDALQTIADIANLIIVPAPGGILTADTPPNVSARFEAGAIAPPFSRRARWAPPIVSGRVPKTFVNTTRARSPPMLV